MAGDNRVQCLIFMVHDSGRPRTKRSPSSSRKLRSSTVREKFLRRSTPPPRTLRNNVSASAPLARAFIMLPEDFLQEHQSFHALLQRNNILVVRPENVARLLVANGNLEGFEILLDENPSASVDPLYVATSETIQRVIQLLFSNVTVRIKPEYTNTVVRPFVDDINLKCIKKLLKHGEVFIEFGNDGFFGSNYGSLLQMAIHRGQVEIARLLIYNGADVHYANMLMPSALHLAVARCPSLVQMLIDKGVSVNLASSFLGSPLHYASTVEAAEVLLQNGANVNSVSGRLKTPLMNAVEMGDVTGRSPFGVMKTLLQYGANVYAKDDSNRSVFEQLYLSRDPNLLKFLFEYSFSEKRLQMRIMSDMLKFLSVEMNRPGYSHAAFKDCETVTINHAVKMIRALQEGSTFSENLQTRLNASSWSRSLIWHSCKDEVVRMASQKLSGTDIPFRDVLSKSPDQVAFLLRNEAVSKMVESEDLETRFPIYGGILKQQFVKGWHRRLMQQEAIKICSRFFSNFKTIPDEIQGRIIGYLNTQDVMIAKRFCTRPTT